ncbi:4'-phosphopantetheinyl transferase [Lachnospiraceae bacterium PF1-21]|uniref:4'-phosphopantetheinyl transferase superfamily protein n=1 Tax=Ohessyouella blattaphilus TaxID=2949333 RepID=UPI003E2F2AF0
MIQTYVADIRVLLNNETYETYYQMMPEFRKSKANAIKPTLKKAQSIGAYALYQKVNTGGNFNLSHSGNYVLCAIGKEAETIVGCDVEHIRPVPMNLAKRYFTEKECAFVFAGESEEARLYRFFRLWVLKESYMKATRLGTNLGTKTFEILFNEKNKPYLNLQPEAYAGEYEFREFRVSDEALCATCGLGERIKDSLEQMVM